MRDLPRAFVEEMTDLWEASDAPASLEAFLSAFSDQASSGLLLNHRKSQAEKTMHAELGHLDKVPWCQRGYFLDDKRAASLAPSYRLGFYYLQDPSAMLPSELAAIQKGERVLDLCAAPGGKAFRAAMELEGMGLLWANERSDKRARALCRNLELGGFPNALITAEDGRKLGPLLAGVFDVVLLDAPCSGSAMFRKDRRSLRAWEQFRGENLASIQLELLEAGAAALRPGGRLVYSTCSFSWSENEGRIQDFLKRHPDFSLCPVRLSGSSPGLRKSEFDGSACMRLWPHLQRAEGQFAALLMKEGEQPSVPLPQPDRRERAGKDILAAWQNFLSDNLTEEAAGAWTDASRLRSRADEVHYLPAESGLLSSLYYLKSGLFLGQVKKTHKNGLEFRPSHALLRSLPAFALRHALEIREGALLKATLRGDTLTREGLVLAAARGEIDEKAAEAFFQVPEGARGALSFHGEPLAWMKRQGQIFKNEQPKGWIPEEGE